jgi:glyceraldehyde-3-phosphate dehydrogenase (NADP+)
MQQSPLYLAGQFCESTVSIPVINPYSRAVVAHVAQAQNQDIESAIQAAVSCKKNYDKWSSLQVSQALLKISLGIESHQERFIQTLISESAKPYLYAKGEVLRAIETFRMAAFEATKIPHELIDLSDAASGVGLKGRIQYSSTGIIAGISPFNFPLNLVAHKIAPAIATKSPIILKPSSKTPLTALLLAEIISDCKLPEGAISVLPCSREVGESLITDERIGVLSFTGSPEVGWAMKARAGKKKVVLELGGNAAALVLQDADFELALNQCLTGTFAFSGQVCIHTQRIYVHEHLFEAFTEALVNRAKALKNLAPEDPSSIFSVMIDEANAVRVENWCKEALEQGARLRIGGKRQQNYFEPSIFTHTSRGMKIHDEEVFGPVVCINSFSTLDEAIDAVNDSRFGLQAAVFTNDQQVIERCFDALEVGGVILNRATTYRTDQMPYGGVKDSGFGREGIKYAMLDYLEPKILVF